MMIILGEIANVLMADLGFKKLIICGISRLRPKAYMNRNHEI